MRRRSEEVRREEMFIARLATGQERTGEGGNQCDITLWPI